MKKLLMVIPLVILLCFTFGCQKQAEEVAEEVKPVIDVKVDIEAIKAFFETLEFTIETEDFERWIALFAEDVIKMPPNKAIIQGKDAVRQWGQPYFTQFDMEESILIEEIEVLGNWAFARITATFKGTPKAGGEAVLMNGKAVWILKRQTDGSWKCSHHIWNSNPQVK